MPLPAVILLLLIASTPQSSPANSADIENRQPKRAWEYSDDERLAIRFDATSIRARAAHASAEASQRKLHATTNAESLPDALLPNTIDGKRNPELFMPHELFTSLVADLVRGPAERREQVRAKLSAVIRPSMDPDDFWRRFDAAVAPYVALAEREQSLVQRINAASAAERTALFDELRLVQEPMCAARARSLRAAAIAIGRQPLYRLLYEAVAPQMAITMSPAADAQQVKFIAEGCE